MPMLARLLLAALLATALDAAPQAAQVPLEESLVRIQVWESGGNRWLKGHLLERDSVQLTLLDPDGSTATIALNRIIQAAEFRGYRSGAMDGLILGAVGGGLTGVLWGGLVSEQCSGQDWLCFSPALTLGIQGLFLGAIAGTLIGSQRQVSHWERVPTGRLRVVPHREAGQTHH